MRRAFSGLMELRRFNTGKIAHIMSWAMTVVSTFNVLENVACRALRSRRPEKTWLIRVLLLQVLSDAQGLCKRDSRT